MSKVLACANTLLTTGSTATARRRDSLFVFGALTMPSTTSQYLTQVACISLRSPISSEDSPLVCAVGTLAAARLVAVVRLDTAVDDLTLAPDLLVTLVTLVVVSVVLEGALVAVEDVTVGDTDTLRDDAFGAVDALIEVAPDELAEAADELKEARTGDTIDAPGVSDEAEVP